MSQDKKTLHLLKISGILKREGHRKIGLASGIQVSRLKKKEDTDASHIRIMERGAATA